MYISQDPIGLAGNNPNFYADVFDSNIQVDVFGLLIVALGIDNYLDDFAKRIGGKSWKEWAKDNPQNWKNILLDLASDSNNSLHFNLDGIDDPFASVMRAARNSGGATDWELLQLKMNSDIWDITFWKNNEIVKNPFTGEIKICT